MYPFSMTLQCQRVYFIHILSIYLCLHRNRQPKHDNSLFSQAHIKSCLRCYAMPVVLRKAVDRCILPDSSLNQPWLEGTARPLPFHGTRTD